MMKWLLLVAISLSFASLCWPLDDGYSHRAMMALHDAKLEKLNTRLDGMDKALELKNKELEWRLEDLNNWKKETINERENLLNKETYNIKTEYYDRWIATVNDRLTILETIKSIVFAQTIVITGIIFQIFLAYRNKQKQKE